MLIQLLQNNKHNQLYCVLETNHVHSKTSVVQLLAQDSLFANITYTHILIIITILLSTSTTFSSC